MKLWTVILIFFMINSNEVIARTWSVEKDGSGDYRIIQTAVDAAASGDTIRIGIGRFNEPTDTDCVYGVDSTRVLVTQEELVIIGAGHSQTIIGPEDYYSNSNGIQLGIVAVGTCGNSMLKVIDIGFEGLMHSVHAEYSDKISLKGCGFRGCYYGLVSDCEEIQVVDCQAEFMTIGRGQFIVLYAGTNTRTMEVKNCTSLGGGEHSFHIDAFASEYVLVENCSFLWGMGIIVGGSGRILVQDCNFEGQGNYAIWAYGDFVNVNHCQIKDVPLGVIKYYGDGQIHINDVEFSEIGEASFGYRGFSGGAFSNCQLDKGAEYVVKYYSIWDLGRDIEGPPIHSSKGGVRERVGHRGFEAKHVLEEIHLKMTNNWWGSTCPDSINAWIEDGKDIEGLPFFIDWYPALDQPVANQGNTIGGIKALFRGRAK